jgi:tRNA threonylcarbamoyl adenosine modification protein (Sua5/YciO/YrdC/YwlC family)
MILRINPDNPQKRLIDKVVDLLRDGGIIAYPTDTYYGIGCDITCKKSVERIYAMKQRTRAKPFSIICCDLKNISDYAKVSNYAYKTMKRLLPGPYTFILEGSRLLPQILMTKRKTAGIRVPDHAICLDIVRELGHPILSTTATSPDKTVFDDPSFIDEHFGRQIDVVIDGGPVPSQPSSVISLINDEPEVIREGIGDISIFQ